MRERKVGGAKRNRKKERNRMRERKVGGAKRKRKKEKMRMKERKRWKAVEGVK